MKHFSYFVILLISFSASNLFSQDIKEINELYKNQKFKKWIEFWQLKIPEIKNFEIENTHKFRWREPHKIDLRKWFHERRFRKNTLDFSRGKNFVADKYAYISIKEKKGGIYVDGTAADAYCEVVNIKDSVLYSITLYPFSFIDDCVWLPDSVCYFLGFVYDYYPPYKFDDTYCTPFVLKMDLNHSSLSIDTGKKYHFYKKLMSCHTYMKYLNPKYKFE